MSKSGTNSLSGRRQSPEHVAKRIAARKKNGTLSTPAHQQAVTTPEYREQMAAHTKDLWAQGKFDGRIGRQWTDEQKAAASAKRKQMWAEGRYKDAKPASRRSVSVMERSLKPYLAALGYVHTEERPCFIACEDKTRLPDYVNFEAREVFEFFGNFWHHPDDEAQWIGEYAKKGWRCTVLWEEDLRDWLVDHQGLVDAEVHQSAMRTSRNKKRYPRRGNPELCRG